MPARNLPGQKCSYSATLRGLTLILIGLAALRVDAAEFRWEGNCSPFNGWTQTCGGGNNWDQGPGILPGPNDDIFLLNGDPITEPNFSFTVKSVQANASVKFDSGETLGVNENSLFKNLQATGGGIEARNGSMVAITGVSLINVLKSQTDPGLFEITGEWSGAPSLQGNPIVKSFGMGTITATAGFSGDAEMVNEGTLTLLATIQGSTSSLVNNNDLVAEGGGAITLQSDLHNAGNLVAQGVGTELSLQGKKTNFAGGAVTVGADSRIVAQALSGGTQIHQFSAPTVFNGQGIFELVNPYTVSANVISSMGLGTAEAGTGGFNFRGIVNLESGVEFRNDMNGRLVFNNPTIEGMGQLINQGQLANPPGSFAGVGVDLLNEGLTWVAGGSRIKLQDAADLTNQGTVLLDDDIELLAGTELINQAGSDIRFRTATSTVKGSGLLINQGGLLHFDSGSDEQFILESALDNQSLAGNIIGEVRLQQGSLRVAGPLVNLDAGGVLRGGRWTVTSGLLDLPAPVNQIGDVPATAPASLTWVDMGQPQPEFESLAVIESTGRANFSGGQTFNGGLEVRNGGQLSGSALAVNGVLLIGAANDVNIAQFSGSAPVPALLNRTMANNKSTAKTVAGVAASMLQNNGRVLPSGRGLIGELLFSGDYQQGASGRLHIEAASPGTTDLLNIDGIAQLDGILELGRIAGADPQVGVSYTVLTATGGVSGQFSRVVSADKVKVTYLPQSVEIEFLEVVPGLVFYAGFE